MRKNAFFTFAVVILVLSLLLSGCRASSSAGGASGLTDGARPGVDPEASGQNSTVPSAQEDPTTPVCDEDCLGELADVDFSDDNWVQMLLDSGGVYQVVYQYDRENDEVFDPEDMGTFLPLRVRQYASFPSVTNNPRDASAYVKSKNGYEASVRIKGLMSESVTFGPSYAPVGDLAAIALLEKYVLPLEYVPAKENWDLRDWVAAFTVNGPENSGEYVIDRDGTVYRNGSAVAVSLVPEEVTDYLFAVCWSYVMSGWEEFSFAPGIEFYDNDCLHFSSEEEDFYLLADDANTLVQMLSDREDLCFSCEPGFNCPPEDHGRALYEITPGSYDPERGFTESWNTRHFILWEDGRITFSRPAVITYGSSLDHDLLCDWLTLPCPYVSAAAFDVEQISAFLAEKSG